MVAATVSGAVGEIRAGSTPVFRTIFVFKEEKFSMKLNKYYSMFKNLGLSKSLLQDAYQYENTHETFYSRCQEALRIRCSKFGNPAITDPRNPRTVVVYTADYGGYEYDNCDSKCFPEEAEILLHDFPDVYFKTPEEAIRTRFIDNRGEAAVLVRNCTYWAKKGYRYDGTEVNSADRARELRLAAEYKAEYDDWCDKLSKLNAGDESIIYSSLAAGTHAKMVETMEYYERYWRNYARRRS